MLSQLIEATNDNTDKMNVLQKEQLENIERQNAHVSTLNRNLESMTDQLKGLENTVTNLAHKIEKTELTISSLVKSDTPLWKPRVYKELCANSAIMSPNAPKT